MLAIGWYMACKLDTLMDKLYIIWKTPTVDTDQNNCTEHRSIASL